jgi:SAM-dependent methyltransferase
MAGRDSRSSVPEPASSHSWGTAPDFYGPRHDYRESLMLRTLKPLLPGRAVLNAGCGAGSLTLKLLDSGYQVTSVDASEEFVGHLRRRLAERGLSAPVVVGDLEDLDLPERAFDGVACGEVLEHLDDDRRPLAELARVMRPGGAIVITVPANPWRYDWVDLWAGHRRRYTPQVLEERLEQAGFSDVRVTPWGFPMSGLYHRLAFKPALRRRLERGDLGSEPVSGGVRRLFPLVRAALEIDTLFVGRFPGYFGLLASAGKR